MSEVSKTVSALLAYCRANDWAGYDPYDALNSKLFGALPFLDFKASRIALTQALKRSPVNLRSLLFVPKTKNPKALALFLSSLLKLHKLGLVRKGDLSLTIADELISLRSAGEKYSCWGYSFPWQTRTVKVPRGAPNLVCTTFVASSLLDAHDELDQARFLEIALSAGEYLVNELYYTESDRVASFHYPLPTSKAKVHNANFLAAALLSRLFYLTGDARFLVPALAAARYSVSRQNHDGSWSYGESSSQQWIDNFHTGYNLCALRAIAQYAKTSEFDANIRNGFQFYRNHFFREDGAPRYFHDRTYPIDVHCIAQSILTLLEFQDLDQTAVELAGTVYHWAMKNMWSEAGFFYYRKLRTLTIRTSYIRWSQAWMLLALTRLLEEEMKETPLPGSDRPMTIAVA